MCCIFSKDRTTELDFMMKLWGEIIELLVGGDNNLYIKWGETPTDTSTAIKRVNNDNKPHTIGCKVDGRIVCQVSKIVDTCHVEAAKASAGFGKLVGDKVKLAVESKCTIDDLVMSGKLKKQRMINKQHVQIFGLQATTCTLTLVDRGFYVNCVDFDLSFSNSIQLFAENALIWIRRLMLLKKTCRNMASLFNQVFYDQPISLNKMFNLNDPDTHHDKYCNQSWVTGTFIPPTNTPAVFPKEFLTGALSKKQSNQEKTPSSFTRGRYASDPCV